jgi:hypothetical protein
MKSKLQFTQNEAAEIRRLLRLKVSADHGTQKQVRAKIREIGFYISDFDRSKQGVDESDFDALVRDQRIKITA